MTPDDENDNQDLRASRLCHGWGFAASGGLSVCRNQIDILQIQTGVLALTCHDIILTSEVAGLVVVLRRIHLKAFPA